jgi:hypothetical protein
MKELARLGSGRVAALVATLVLISLYLGPALFGPNDLVAGDVRIFEGERDRFLSASLRAGHGIPTWVPGIRGGAPAVGSPELGLFYPPVIVLALLTPERAVTISLAFHFAVAALGAYTLARKLGAAASASILGAVAWAFGGALACETSWPILVAANSWTVWFAWGLLRALDRERGGLAVMTLAVLAIFLAENPQTCPIAAVIGLALAGARDPRQLPRAAVLVALAAVGCALLAAVQFLPAAAVFDETARAQGFTLEASQRWSVWPPELAGLVVPFAFGAHLVPSSLWINAVYPGEERAWAEAYYVGPVVLALAGAGLARVRTSALARGGLALLLLFLPIAFGKYAPVFGWLHEHAPAASYFKFYRFPGKLGVPAMLGLSLLAIAGAGGLSDPRRRRALALVLGIETLVLVGAAVVVLGYAPELGAQVDSLGAASVSGAQAIASLAPRLGHAAIFALGATALAAKRRRRLVSALAALTVLDLGLALRPVFITAPRDQLEAAPRIAPALEALAREEGAPVRVVPWAPAAKLTPEDPTGPGALDMAILEGLTPNTGLTRGILSQGGMLASPPLRIMLVEYRARSLPFHRQAILRGARAILVPNGDVDVFEGEVAPVASLSGRTLLRFVHAPPWAALYGRARHVASRKAALEAVLDPAFDPTREVVLESEGGETCDPDAARGRARLASTFENDRFEVALDAPGSGWLVVREGFARGWRAFVDGEEAPIVAADVHFRAVFVRAQARRVAFVYEPPRLWLGVAISAVSAVVLTLVFFVSSRRRQRVAFTRSVVNSPA